MTNDHATYSRWNPKLTEEDVQNILTIHADYLALKKKAKELSPSLVSKKLGYASSSTYFRVIRGEPTPATPKTVKTYILDCEKERKRIAVKIDAIKPETVAKKFDISVSHYRDIVSGQRWRNAMVF